MKSALIALALVLTAMLAAGGIYEEALAVGAPSENFSTPEAPLSGFHFSNVNIEADRGLRIRNAELESKGLNLQVKAGPVIQKDAGAIVHQ